MSDPYAIDAEFYDFVHGRGGEDIALWRSFALQADGPVLEVGTGTGRIAVALTADSTVTGIDPSVAMLAIASSEAAEAGVEVDLRCGLATGTDLEPDCYGLVILPADVFLYCTNAAEQLATLEALRACMTPGGTLAIDVAGPELWLDPGSNGQPLSVFHGVLEDGATIDVHHTHQDDLVAQTRSLQITYEIADQDGAVTCRQTEHNLRYVYPFELILLLERAGLTPLATYGDYDRGPLTNDSDRMIVVARRSQA
jgi:SAM-dependent methyltransferase